MKFIKFNVYGTEFGIDKVTQLFEMKGITAAEIDKEDENSVIGKYVVRDYNDEKVASAFYTDDEESHKLIKEFKVLVMMLKSKEQYGDFGWDVTMGRMYAMDFSVDETNLKEL